MGSSVEKVFVADKAFWAETNCHANELVSIFPESFGDRVYRSTMDDLLSRSRDQHIFYQISVPKLKEIIGHELQYHGGSLESNVRLVLAKILPLYLDRVIRISHSLKSTREDPTVTKIIYAEVESIQTFEHFNDFPQSWHFNQYIIQRIMRALGYDGREILKSNEYPEFPRNYEQVNLLFSPSRQGFLKYIVRLESKIFALLGNLSSPRAKLLSLTFGPDHYYMVKRGLLGPFGFFHKPLRFELIPSRKCKDLRKRMFLESKHVLRLEINELLQKSNLSLSKSEVDSLGELFWELFFNWYPISLLEGLKENIAHICSKINVKKFKAFVGHDVLTDKHILLCLAGRDSGVSIIGVQHGGHYGYIEDMSIFSLEYGFYDSMVTWGWDEVDSHFPSCQFVKLPVPKMSERPLRSNYLENLKCSTRFQSDVLFYQNLFHRFPYSSTNGNSRVDFIDDIFESNVSVVRELSSLGIKMTMKPYNMKFIDLYSDFYSKLREVGGSNFSILNSTQKGLSVELIKKYKIVLWDQIGTGTIECFTSDVPAIVYWKRIYSREFAGAKELISGLEKNGVLHSSPESLALEISRYLNNPEKWMNDPSRRVAIARFCDEYASVSLNWKIQWRSYLKQISS